MHLTMPFTCQTLLIFDRGKKESMMNRDPCELEQQFEGNNILFFCVFDNCATDIMCESFIFLLNGNKHGKNRPAKF